MYYKYIRRISFLIVALFLLSCSADLDDELAKSKAPIDGKAVIALQLPTVQSDGATTRSADNESLINNLSLFIFNKTTGAKEFYVRLNVPTDPSTEVDMSRWASDQVIMLLNSAILSDLSISRNIHVVANVNESKLNAISSESNLKAVITDAITAEIAEPDADKPFVMHGVKESHVFATDNRASVSLVRNIAKVQMTINTQNFTFGGAAISLAPLNQNPSVKMVNVADRTYLVSNTANPATATYFSYANKVVTPSERTATTTKTIAHSYIGENLRTTYDIEKNATYLLLQIPYQKGAGGEIITDNYYKVLINKENGYKINRNTIYDLTLNISSLGGETDASAALIEGTLNILPWDENTVMSDISQTFLTVKEIETAIGVKKDFYYATNAETSDCSLESGAPWLTASFDAANNIKLVADGADYTVPRTTTLKIKVKNLTKTITVNQAAMPVTNGSIKLDPKVIYISEVSPSKNVALTVNPTTSFWTKIAGDPTMASCDAINGTGNKTLKFTSQSTYGNTEYQFMNTSTLEYDIVKVCNLSLTSSVETMEIPSAGLSGDISGIVALGGNADWVVKSKSSWITKAQKEDGKLVYVISAEVNAQDREGEIIINHVDDVNLIRIIKVKQSAKFVVFPKFDYLVIRYRVGLHPQHASGKRWDMDSATFFGGTGITTLDNYGVGYAATGNSGVVRQVFYKSEVVMQFGGDNTQSGYETTYINFKDLVTLSTFDDFPPSFTVQIYARWWTTGINNYPIHLDIVTYLDGDMESDETYDFKNVGGTIGVDDTYSFMLEVNNQTTPIAPDHYDSSQLIGYVTYNKVESTAVFTKVSADLDPNAPVGASVTPLSSSSRGVSLDVEPLPGETKDEYAMRLWKLRNNKK
ncbi:BACON domain-containing protein [Dysgonomonas sp. ZJ279]|uniref:BACON domain-containing protein n=1 Tax=Dysgonomonas sp. ZJ279 TaxID=2709796 RepID=UPI0013E9FBC6|nr:BACON domain-containing carbohydrate-binding protein [Dysgonomonas sp. ZJ279]